MSTAHSWLFQVPVETGVPGLLLQVALWGLVAVVSIRWIWSYPAGSGDTRVLFAGAWAACAAYLAASLLIPGSPPASLLLWCLLGVLLSPLAKPVESVSRAGTLAFVSAALLVGVLGVAVTSVWMYADRRAAVAADVEASPMLRIAAAVQASSLNPLSAAYAALEAEAYRSLLIAEAVAPVPGAPTPVALERAEAALLRAIDLEPTNPYPPHRLHQPVAGRWRAGGPGSTTPPLAKPRRQRAPSSPTTSTSPTGTRRPP